MDGTKIKALLESKNVADELDDEKLITIGTNAREGFELDLASRKDWEDAMEEWIKLAKQVAETKSYPWNGASNVKYPLLSTAAMQFAARAYPSLVPSDRQLVKGRPIGPDPTGQKTQVAEAVSKFMSYQLMDEMDGWEEDMDKLLIMLPIVGVMFKKTYWDSVKKVNCSRLVLPKNFVVDYWTRSLRDAERISEIVQLTKRKVKERQLAGLWLDVELGEPQTPDGESGEVDETTPYEFIEQHTYIDLDDDDYAEPYVVTFERNSGKVVRVTACFDQDTMTMNDKGEVIQIERIEYYTKYGFIPSPDGGFYDVGFGTLLGPINESVNTLINQLVDAGHMSSLQSGFLGKGLRLRMGEAKFKPGEWKVVNATGEDLNKQIVPLPIKEPSSVLLELMGSLITSGKELASVAEIFVGKMPGQNTPATTTMATIEQGMKVFTAVYKRIYRSLSEEFQKLYRLNAVYLDPQTDVEALDMQIQQGYFDNKSHKIYPGADPTAISQTEKLMKAQGLMELLPTGVLDPVAVVTRIMEAQEQPNWQELLNQAVKQTGQLPPPPPDPKLQEMQMKGQLEQQKMQAQLQTDSQRMELEKRDKETQLAMKAQEHEMEMQHRQQQMVMSAAEAEHKQKIFSAEAQLKLNQQAMQGHQEAVHAEQQHQVAIAHAHEAGATKVELMKKQAAAKPKAETKGKAKK
jgi:chaperonin GroES